MRSNAILLHVTRRAAMMSRGLILTLILGGCSALEPSDPLVTPSVAAPSRLQLELEKASATFDGSGGAAVRDLREGWTAAIRGFDPYPQQSVFKLWVAVALLDAVDRDSLSLNEQILVRRADLSVFAQPLAEKVGADGYTTTLEELLNYMVVRSDNAATDLIIRRLGGPTEIQAVLKRKGIRGVRVDRSERDLQAQISGLSWQPEYSEPAAFDAARAGVPEATRLRARDAYLIDLRDTATPVGTTDGLAALNSGRLLSPLSTDRLLGLMRMTIPGSKRLKAGLPEGWTIAHRPGTAGGYGGVNLATNNVGVITAPDGHSYAVAVFLKGGRGTLDAREGLIADVARAVVAHWRREHECSRAALRGR